MKVEQTSFVFEGKKIGGFLYVPDGEGKFPAVVLVHGFGGGVHEPKNKFMCEQLCAEGFVAFMFDFYDKPNGLSEFSIEKTSVTLQLGVLRAAMDYVCGLFFVVAGRVGLSGHSLGGMTVLLYTPTDNRVKALVVQSALSDFKEKTLSHTWGNITNWKERGYKIFDKSWGGMNVSYNFVADGLTHDVYGAAGRIKCPVLVFHGDKDESVPLEQSERLMKSLKKMDEFVVLAGSGHTYNEKGMKEKTTALLVDFMKKKL